MSTATVHNPDRYMSDLREILSQGRKRIGLLIGAGGPTSIRVDSAGRVASEGRPLIPDVAGLTDEVIRSLDTDQSKVIEAIRKEFSPITNIEAVLTRVRRLSQAIGTSRVHGFDGSQYERLGQCICDLIGKRVKAELPREPTPFSELISWVAGTHREHAVEIFTPNYDLLIEEAFERSHLPYFDGFTGSREPFFDAASIAYSDQLPTRWSRLWKLHGSLGWKRSGETIIRTGDRSATELIYPDHLKYDEITRLPYSALFERLRGFLTTPDSLLITSGFSFGDAHISAVLSESLKANAHTAILAFQYRSLDEEKPAVRLATNHPNLSVYARDGAVISGLRGDWYVSGSTNDEWREIRQTFWSEAPSKSSEFLLGDFARLARFFAVAQARQMHSQPQTQEQSDERSKASQAIAGSDAKS